VGRERARARRAPSRVADLAAAPAPRTGRGVDDALGRACARGRPGEHRRAPVEQLLQRGRDANLEGNAAQAAPLLGEALSLWRGDALGDLAYLPFARHEAERLAELRLAAIEERIDARLALGEHVGVIGELDKLLSEHPTRERTAGQLMLALLQRWTDRSRRCG
jgi:hypothetical protein